MCIRHNIVREGKILELILCIKYGHYAAVPLHNKSPNIEQHDILHIIYLLR